MVGSVLLERMAAEGDLAHCEPVYFQRRRLGKRSGRREVIAVRLDR